MIERIRDRMVALYARRWSVDEDGASATEYAVIVAIVVAALVLIGGIFTDVLQQLWTGMVENIRDNFLS